MAARDQLIAYGYRLEADGRYRRPGRLTQVWQELEDGKGWLRFDPDGRGDEVPEVYTIAPEYQGTSGLSKIHHPGAFTWVWPEEEVERIYGAAVEAAAGWAAEAVARKGRAASAILPTEAAPTPDQMAAMQNAQVGQAAAAESRLAPRPETKRHWWQRD